MACPWLLLSWRARRHQHRWCEIPDWRARLGALATFLLPRPTRYMRTLKAFFRHFTPVDYAAIGFALVLFLGNMLANFPLVAVGGQITPHGFPPRALRLPLSRPAH